MLDVRWRPRAQLDRESIAIHLGVDCRSPQAALSAMRAIDEAVSQVRAFPESGRAYPDEALAHEGYRVVEAGCWLVFYRHDAEAVTVWRVLHRRQDIDTYAFMRP